MGLTDLPRVTFSGFTYWNPSTMNNNDYQPTYDPASATLSWPWLERHGLATAAGFDDYVTKAPIVATPNDALNANIDPTAPPAEWNFYGGNQCGFVQNDVPELESENFSKPPGPTAVTGFTDLSGTRVLGGSDPWIGQPVALNVGLDEAKLVDVDPIAPWSSQIFVDTFDIGTAQAAVGVTGPTEGRAHSRWLNFCRNYNQQQDVILAGVASTAFQLALPAADLEWRGTTGPNSVAAQLQKALKLPGARGLMVRFVTYHTVYFQGPVFTVVGKADWAAITTLYCEYATARAAYEAGELAEPPPVPVNRAYSNTVGWIAPWTTSDMISAPVGRPLFSHTKFVPPPTKPSLTTRPLGPAAIEVTVDAADPNVVARISVDLGSTMPEADSTLTKVDFGTMQLAVQPTPTSTPVPFAQIPYNDAADAVAYDAAAYVAGAGVVDIPASQLLIQPLTVTDLQAQVVATLPDPSNPSDRIVVLRERELTAETDDRGVYLDECGAPWSPKDPTVEVQVRFRGGPPPAGTRLRIAQYSPDFPGFGEMNWALVSSTAGDGAQQPFVEMTVQGGSVVDGAYAIVAVPPAQPGSRSAVVNLALTALRPGPPILQFSALAASDEAGAPLAMVPFPQNLDDGFANARVLPFHNAMADAYQNWLLTGPGVDLATQRLFDSVFRTFFLMYPAMRFLRDPLQFQAWRARIVAATDPAIFETAAYMPVTRPLSAGQRQMLLDWSHYVDGTVPTPPRGATHARRG